MEYKCPNCGGVSQAEICPYCGTALHRNSQELAPEYPVLPCKEARISFLNTVFPAIFALAFGGAGLGTLISFVLRNPFAELGASSYGALSITVPFLLIGTIAFVLTLIPIIRCIIVAVKGEDKTAVVYGYVDDNVIVNGLPAQTVKLLVQTMSGPKFILYQTGKTYKPYVVNSTINVRCYKQYFKIIEEKLA